MSNIHQEIDTLIKAHDIVLFMKGTKQFPQCGFSSVVAQILTHLHVPFHDINVLENMELREGIKVFSDWPTIPQLYVKGQFIGGCDIVKEMFETGELETLLKEEHILSLPQN